MSFLLVVTLSSSLSRNNRSSVCHNETVLYECSVSGTSLVWRLSGFPRANHLYIQADRINEARFVGPSVMWLTNNQKMTSHLVLSYDPELNNSTVQCLLSNSNFESHTYIIAGIYVDFGNLIE